jgi:hypothetical protein
LTDFVIGNGNGGRFASKKAIKDHLNAGNSVDFVATSFFNPTNYTLEDAPLNKPMYFVGPEALKRVYYGSITVKTDKDGNRKAVVK